MKKALKNYFEKDENYHLNNKDFNNVKKKLTYKDKEKKNRSRISLPTLSIAFSLVVTIGVGITLLGILGNRANGSSNQSNAIGTKVTETSSNGVNSAPVSASNFTSAAIINSMQTPPPNSISSGGGNQNADRIRGGDISNTDSIPSNGHFFAYEIDKMIPANNNYIDITLFIGHKGTSTDVNDPFEGPLIDFNGNGEMNWNEARQLIYRVDFFTEDHFTPLIDVLPDYLSNDYKISIGAIDSEFEPVIPPDEIINYPQSFEVKILTASVITSEQGKIRLSMVQVNPLRNEETMFAEISISYLVSNERIHFSNDTETLHLNG